MIAEFTEKQPDYRYMEIGKYADVMIFSFKDEKTYQNEENEQKIYIYEVNIFRCGRDEITEEMIKSNIDYYLNYQPPKTEYYTKEEVDSLIKKVITTISAGTNF